jgi:hypothetical protein
VRKPSRPDAEQALVYQRLGIDYKQACPILSISPQTPKSDVLHGMHDSHRIPLHGPTAGQFCLTKIRKKWGTTGLPGLMVAGNGTLTASISASAANTVGSAVLFSQDCRSALNCTV